MVNRANLSIFHLFFSLFADINEPPYFCLCSDSLKFLLTLCILFVSSYLWRFIDPHSIAQKCTNMHILTKCFLFLYLLKSPENKIRRLERFLTTMLEKGNDWRNIHMKMLPYRHVSRHPRWRCWARSVHLDLTSVTLKDVFLLELWAVDWLKWWICGKAKFGREKPGQCWLN